MGIWVLLTMTQAHPDFPGDLVNICDSLSRSLSRQIASSPEKILDAPDMINDFYLHLMDWSSLNHMAVALSAGVYIWNATDGTILQLCQREVEEEYVSSVSWIKVR